MQKQFNTTLENLNLPTQFALIVLGEDLIWPDDTYQKNDASLIEQLNSQIENSSEQYFAIVPESCTNFKEIIQAANNILKSRSVEIIVRYEANPFLLFTRNAWQSLGKFNPEVTVALQSVDLLVRAEHARSLSFIETGNHSVREKATAKRRTLELDRLLNSAPAAETQSPAIQ